MRAHELAIGVSCSRLHYVERSTTEGADISIDTTDRGVPVNRTRQLFDYPHYALQACFTYHLILYFLCIWDNCMISCWGWGKWNVSARVKSE